MKEELSTSLIGSINESHKRFVALGERNRDGLIDQINTARETGALLMSHRDAFKRAPGREGKWLASFQTARGNQNPGYEFNFSYEMGCLYIDMAAALPEIVTSLPAAVNTITDMMRACGALPASSRGQQQGRGDLGPFSAMGKRLSSFYEVLRKQSEKSPMTSWPAEQRAHLKEELRPAVELYAAL